MGKKVRIQQAPGDRGRLEALIVNGNTPQKHVWRVRIVLLAGDGVGTDELQRRLRASKPTIRCWRYVGSGVGGLCPDRTRPPGKAPLWASVVNRVLEKTVTETPPATTPDLGVYHLIADNYATHKHPKVRAWLVWHPRFHMHFTPTSASRLNLVDRFFAAITRKRIRRGCSTPSSI